MFKKLKALYKNMVWVVVCPINVKNQPPLVTDVMSDFSRALKEARLHGGFVMPAFRLPIEHRRV